MPEENVARRGKIPLIPDKVEVSKPGDPISELSAKKIFLEEKYKLNGYLNKKETATLEAITRKIANGGGRGPYKKDFIANLYQINKGRLTQEVVRCLFDYDETTGILTRKVNRSGKHGLAGEEVGTVSPSHGYLMVRVGPFGSKPAHRIIWLWVHGYYPENMMDHINRNRLDNRIANLREVSPQCNARNRGVRSESRTRIKGVGICPRSGRFFAHICVKDQCKTSLGYHEDLTEAVCHRYAAEQCLNWNDCDLNSSAYQYLKKQGVIK